MLLDTQSATNGGNVTYRGSTPTKASTAAATYTFSGWSRTIGGEKDANALVRIIEDRYLYAVFTESVRTYTVRYYVGSKLVQTKTNVPYGSSVYYDGETPTNTSESNPDDYEFIGWDKLAENIKGDVNCYAQFRYTGLLYRHLLDGKIQGEFENSYIKIVGKYGLGYWTSLTAISLPNVETVGYRAFYGDNYNGKVTKLSLPKLKSAGEQAFYEMRYLEEADVKNLQTLGERGFYHCSSLKMIDLPELTEVPGYAFYGCTELETVNISKATAIGGDAFGGCNKMKSVVLGEGLTTIKSYAFRSCLALEEIVLPSTLSQLENYAFQYCSAMKKAYFMGKPKPFSAQVFNNCSGLTDIYVAWNSGEISGAPWGATNATIHYADEGWMNDMNGGGNN